MRGISIYDTEYARLELLMRTMLTRTWDPRPLAPREARGGEGPRDAASAEASRLVELRDREACSGFRATKDSPQPIRSRPGGLPERCSLLLFKPLVSLHAILGMQGAWWMMGRLTMRTLRRVFLLLLILFAVTEMPTPEGWEDSEPGTRLVSLLQ
jgi:hypothetical protein